MSSSSSSSSSAAPRQQQQQQLAQGDSADNPVWLSDEDDMRLTRGSSTEPICTGFVLFGADGALDVGPLRNTSAAAIDIPVVSKRAAGVAEAARNPPLTLLYSPTEERFRRAMQLSVIEALVNGQHRVSLTVGPSVRNKDFETACFGARESVPDDLEFGPHVSLADVDIVRQGARWGGNAQLYNVTSELGHWARSSHTVPAQRWHSFVVSCAPFSPVHIDCPVPEFQFPAVSVIIACDINDTVKVNPAVDVVFDESWCLRVFCWPIKDGVFDEGTEEWLHFLRDVPSDKFIDKFLTCMRNAAKHRTTSLGVDVASAWDPDVKAVLRAIHWKHNGVQRLTLVLLRNIDGGHAWIPEVVTNTIVFHTKCTFELLRRYLGAQEWDPKHTRPLKECTFAARLHWSVSNRGLRHEVAYETLSLIQDARRVGDGAGDETATRLQWLINDFKLIANLQRAAAAGDQKDAAVEERDVSPMLAVLKPKPRKRTREEDDAADDEDGKYAYAADQQQQQQQQQEQKADAMDEDEEEEKEDDRLALTPSPVVAKLLPPPKPKRRKLTFSQLRDSEDAKRRLVELHREDSLGPQDNDDEDDDEDDEVEELELEFSEEEEEDDGKSGYVQPTQLPGDHDDDADVDALLDDME